MSKYRHFWPYLIGLIMIWNVLFQGLALAAPEEENETAEHIIINRTDFPRLFMNDPLLEGEAVWMLEARLHEQGYDIAADGVFDQQTAETVRLFQLAHQLKTNGIVDQTVWESLMCEEDGRACLITEESKTEKRKVRIEIDLITHKLTLYENNQPIKTYPVGIGKGSTPSPLGEWKVANKGVGWGNGFGTRWMGLNVPWGIYGIHGTNKPYSVGASESHGCIRMLNRHVEELYPLVPIGTQVKIMENGQIFPKNFKPKTLSRKASGQNVVYLQSRLKEKGIIFDNADGRFGAMTELALRYYQTWNGLEVTGIADEATYRSLGMIK